MADRESSDMMHAADSSLTGKPPGGLEKGQKKGLSGSLKVWLNEDGTRDEIEMW